MLADLSGTVQADVRGGSVTGIDATAAKAALADGADDTGALQSRIATSLASGTTSFSSAKLSAQIAHGLVTLQDAALSAEAGALRAEGTVDLPSEALDLSLNLRPALAGAPDLGIRLIGPLERPRRALDLTALTRWLAGQ